MMQASTYHLRQTHASCPNSTYDTASKRNTIEILLMLFRLGHRLPDATFYD